MSPPLLLVSDVHTREESADVVFDQVFPGIWDAAQEHHVERVVCLGDFWHLRYRLPVVLLNRLREWLQRFAACGICWDFLPGNHDQVDVAGRNALEVLDEMPSVTVHSEPHWDERGLWVPYRPTLDQIAAAVATPRPARLAQAPSVCWLHYGVRGAMRNSRVADTDGIEPHRFEAFDAVLCGHYHKQQALGPGGKIQYIGSPYQTRADEAGDAKGLALWDGQRLTRLDRAFGARYVKAHLASVDAIDALAPGADGDMHRITLAAGVDMKAVAARLEARGITRYTLTPEPEPFVARLTVDDNESVEAYAGAYLAQKIEDPTEREAYWQTFLRLSEGHHDCETPL